MLQASARDYPPTPCARRACAASAAGPNRKSAKIDILLLRTPKDPDASLQLQRRTRGAARTRAAAGGGGNARLARQRHVGDGNEPPGQGVHQHCRQGGSRPAHAAGHSTRLQGAVPAGRGDRRKRDRPDEPAAGTHDGGLRQHRRMVEEVDQGGEEVLHGAHRGVLRGQGLHVRSGAERMEIEPGPGLRARVHQRDHRRRRIPVDAGDRQRAAGGGHVLAHPVAARRRGEIRRHLRRRAEEHGPGRADAGDRPRRPARPCAADHAVGIPLEGTGRGGLHAQHAGDVRHLHRRPGVRVAAGARRARGDRAQEHRQGGAALRLPGPSRRSIAAPFGARIVRA